MEYSGHYKNMIHVQSVLIILLICGCSVTVKADITANNNLTNSFCGISGCDVINCAHVPTSRDGGEEASRFIASEFKMQCPYSTSIKTINFYNCNFYENKLGPYWLRSDLPIDEICFRDTYLSEIMDDAFSQEIFSDLKSLSIMENNVSSLKKSIFKKMSNLRSFLVHDNLIRYAEADLLHYVASSLEVLELDRSINNLEVLNNITGKGAMLNVQIVSIQGNLFHTLTSETFSGIGNVQSLYIDKSEIINIPVDVFRPVSSLSQLFLRNNKLSTLSQGIFDPILTARKTNFHVAISNNPWHCDCNLKWLKEIMNTYKTLVMDKPTCTSPENVAFQQINDVELCSSIQPSTIITDIPITSLETLEYPKVENNITCEKLFSAIEYQIFIKFLLSHYYLQNEIRNFTVHELNNGSILVNLDNLHKTNRILLWFDITELFSSIQNENSNIHCIENIYNSVVLNNVKEGVIYTICVLESSNTFPFPLKCLTFNNNLDYKSKSWISNKDKSTTIAIVVLVLILLCLCSGFIVFLIIRKYPNLLRGNKRIIIVRHREIRAIILPSDIRLNSGISSDTLILEDADYITPLANNVDKRKNSHISQTSSQISDTSYISGIEPNLLQLISWRNNRAKYEVPPPLPPHPLQIPSVSKVVESNLSSPNLNKENIQN